MRHPARRHREHDAWPGEDHQFENAKARWSTGQPPHRTDDERCDAQPREAKSRGPCDTTHCRTMFALTPNDDCEPAPTLSGVCRQRFLEYPTESPVCFPSFDVNPSSVRFMATAGHVGERSASTLEEPRDTNAIIDVVAAIGGATLRFV